MSLRDIVKKAVELQAAAEILNALKQDKSTAQSRLTTVNGEIVTQQAKVDVLVAELKVLVQ